MSLGKVKRNILEELWKESAPLRATDLSKRLNLKFQLVMMHVIELGKMGYVESSQKGYYKITQPGREALGFSPLTTEFVKKVASPLPLEKAFHFFTGIGNYTGTSATSLQDFCEKIKTINKRSVRFHFLRGDFERWLEFIGDKELARKISLLKGQNPSDEQLRQAIHEIVRNRCSEIKAILA